MDGCRPVFEFLLIPLALVGLLLLISTPLIVIYLFVRLTEEALEQVGFGHWHASLMVFGSVLGSLVDIPIHSGVIEGYPSWFLDMMSSMSIAAPVEFHPIVLSVNLGGCVIPLLISLDILRRGRTSLSKASAATLLVAIVTYQSALPVANEGIVLPVYVPPATAAVVAVILSRGYRSAPSLAYIGGSMGTLLGADVFNLLTPGVLPALAPPVEVSRALPLSIGGAGVFDGIFLTGILAVLLASLVVCILGGATCRRNIPLLR
ncbi:MAG: hypothetical protein A4E45_00950 [Methanosaeta sp. PtaB.Bin039]|nr:MAG: hypothetical protein A4E45_00950 [Methanosaeta sp. PtaB.Bin039]OPY45052.1 MAG: hypothetical protein A4E47_01173 [Methanosaeta sp. PtaU1.Bin028]